MSSQGNSDLLKPEALLSRASELLPTGETELKSPAAALTTLVHAVQDAFGFRLKSESTAEQGTNRLKGDVFEKEAYSLKYGHEQSSLTFETVITVLGPRLLVNGMAYEDNKTKSMDIVATDYFSPSAFPVTASTLESAFASANRLKDLTSLYVSSIVYPLAPDLTKSGPSVQGAGDVDDTRLQEDRQRQGIYPDPLAAGPPPRGPFGGMPQQPPPPGGIGGVGPIPPVGRSDLDPLAGMGGTTTGRIPLGGGDGDGMMLGPNHPLFRDRFNGPQPAAPFGGGIGGPPMGPLGSDGFLPPGAVPPGARFDPIVPGPAGRFGPRPGGGPGPVRRGDPDNDEFMPPRNSDYDSMFM